MHWCEHNNVKYILGLPKNNVLTKLGGFLNRKNDGKPGPTPIWKGWQLLQQLAMNLNKEKAKAIFATYG